MDPQTEIPMARIEALMALIEVQKKLSPVGRNAKAARGKYADYTAVWSSVKDAFLAHDFAIMHAMKFIEGTFVIESRLVHSSGHQFTSIFPVIVKTEGMQEYGAALTYAKRYNLLALSGIPVIDEADLDDASHPQERFEFKKEAPLYAKSTFQAVARPQVDTRNEKQDSGTESGADALRREAIRKEIQGKLSGVATSVEVLRDGARSDDIEAFTTWDRKSSAHRALVTKARDLAIKNGAVIPEGWLAKYKGKIEEELSTLPPKVEVLAMKLAHLAGALQ